jgi:hypothetical protein
LGWINKKGTYSGRYKLSIKNILSNEPAENVS